MTRSATWSRRASRSPSRSAVSRGCSPRARPSCSTPAAAVRSSALPRAAERPNADAAATVATGPEGCAGSSGERARRQRRTPGVALGGGFERVQGVPEVAGAGVLLSHQQRQLERRVALRRGRGGRRGWAVGERLAAERARAGGGQVGREIAAGDLPGRPPQGARGDLAAQDALCVLPALYGALRG